MQVMGRSCERGYKTICFSSFDSVIDLFVSDKCTR